jgi:hypothetical protein
MLKNKNGFQVNISLSIFFIAFCNLFTDLLTWEILGDKFSLKIGDNEVY